ncbi:MAG: type II toxin-antitoxin system VapC family toxin [Methylomonas sp.]|nr:type II toxin-antitoxin system VapC family toxin [Methylomonas sp.]
MERMMRLLLDTCIVYDWLMGRIEPVWLVEKIQQEGAFVSAVSIWEMAIKNGLGKLPLPTPALAEDIQAQGFQWLVMTPHHAQAIQQLAQHHKDPFDRLLIAQARCESMRIVTYDRTFQAYTEDVLLIEK